MAKIQISPEQLAKVKQTLNVAAPTGKPTMGAAGKGAQHKAGMPGSGTSAKLPAVTIKGVQEPQPKSGRVQLPSVVIIGGQIYDQKDIFRAHENAIKTYGENSSEARSIRSAAGLVKGANGGYGMAVRTTVKPDMRGDAKSYVDTLQNTAGATPQQAERFYEESVNRNKNYNKTNATGAGKGIIDYAVKTLGTLGIKPSGRNLIADKNAKTISQGLYSDYTRDYQED